MEFKIKDSSEILHFKYSVNNQQQETKSTCFVCNIMFDNVYQKNQHDLSFHLDNVKYSIEERKGIDNSNQCSICFKTLCNKYYLRKHILIHYKNAGKNKKINCSYCNKIFHNYSSYKDHQKYHDIYSDKIEWDPHALLFGDISSMSTLSNSN